MSDVATVVRQFVVDSFLYQDRGAALPDDASFLEAGVIDSTGVLELVAFLEKTFGIKIGDDEIIPHNLDSITRIAAFVRRKQTSA